MVFTWSPPQPKSPFSRVRRTRRARATADRAPARAEARGLGSSPLVAERQGERLPRAGILRGPPDEAVHGQREATRRLAWPSEEAPRLGGPRRESPRALCGLRARRVAAIERLVRVRRGAVAGMRIVATTARAALRALRPAPPRHEFPPRRPSRRGVRMTTPRSTAQSVTAGISRSQSSTRRRSATAASTARPVAPPTIRRTASRGSQGPLPGGSSIGLSSVSVSRCRCARLRVQQRAVPGSRPARSPPRALAEGTARARLPPARPRQVVARAGRRAEQPVGRALLQRRRGRTSRTSRTPTTTIATAASAATAATALRGDVAAGSRAVGAGRAPPPMRAGREI